ncbi:hypothetical protein [Coleofasciculus sp. FACHB-T130]|uniref:hypothetical protein n=1 Tax=Cyanophyceae TaxID=3028117 RepID=UPI00168340DF|nr:hypothetical protein [Coleofasciculus sp. FACHB-T130]MBD1878529.1 hypothetical protein [Coleofasciculus sp. FACHB-T130]
MKNVLHEDLPKKCDRFRKIEPMPFSKILNSLIFNGFGIFGSDEAKSGTMKGGE